MCAQKLFLSYARDDDKGSKRGSFVKKLYDSLTEAGFEVWQDKENMSSRGRTFHNEIRDAIADSDGLVLVVGPAAMDSDYVRAEWEYALNRACKPVHPVLRKGDYTLLPPELKGTDAADFRKDKDFDDKLAYLIRQLTESPAEFGPLHGVQPLPDWYIERPAIYKTITNALCVDTKETMTVSAGQQTVVLQGMGGIGKSTLSQAICCACDIRRTFPDGVFWLEMGKTPNLAYRMGDIGEFLGERRDEYIDIKRAKASLGKLLGDRTVLIVLDDIWDHSHAEPFRVVGPRCRILITTRDGGLATRLGVNGHTLDKLSQEEGLHLIAKRLAMKPDSLPHREELQAIIDLLDGYTLAVNLAAAKLSKFERGIDFAPRLLERLQKRRDGERPFQDLALDEDDKNFNLEVSFSLSYEDLPDDLKRRFRLLGVFAQTGGFSLKAAAYIWEDEDEDAADDALHALCRSALLTRSEGGRYQQHMVLRSYARALLRREGELEDGESRHYDYYHDLASQHNETQDYLGLDPESANLEAAFERAIDEEHYEDAFWLANVCLHFLRNRGRFDLQLNWFQRVAAVLEGHSDRTLWANAQNSLGITYWEYPLGNKHVNLQRAIECYKMALKYHTPQSAPLDYAMTQNNLGLAYRDLSKIQDRAENLQHAITFYTDALKYWTPQAVPLDYAMTQNNLGEAFWQLSRIEDQADNLQRAIECYKMALKYHTPQSAPLSYAITQNNLGAAYRNLSKIQDQADNLQRAIACYTEALQYRTAQSAPLDHAITQANLGNVQDDRGDVDAAVACWREAEIYFRAMGHVDDANTVQGWIDDVTGGGNDDD